jgi:ribose-phosphate pyrophosphokinase
MNLSDALNNAIYEKFKEEPAQVPYSLCVYFEYLPHARADRRFEIGNATPLRRFMNTLGKIFDKIYIEVPHNPDFFKGDSRVVLMTEQIVKGMHRDMVREGSIILLPDAGAVSRFGGMFGDAQIVSASKTRDLHTGKILDVKLSFEDLPKHADVVIFDDICDGGGTFIPIAEQIKKMQPTAKVHLLVVHGIFSKKLKPFDDLFYSVKCRNIVGNFVGTEHLNAFNNK